MAEWKPDITASDPFAGVPEGYTGYVPEGHPRESAAPASITSAPISQSEVSMQGDETAQTQEWADAISFSEKIASGQAQLPPETNSDEYWRSVADIQAKLGLRQEVQTVEQSYISAGAEIPTETQQQIASIKATLAPGVSPFVTIAEDGKVYVDVRTALVAGVKESALRSVVGQQAIDDTKVYLKQDKERKQAQRIVDQYSDLPSAIRAGQIEAVRRAGYDPLDVVDAQIFAADNVLVDGKWYPSAWARGSPEEKFAILVKEGQIPKGAKFEGIDKEGNISYSLSVSKPEGMKPLPQFVITKDRKGKETAFNKVEYEDKIQEILTKRPSFSELEASRDATFELVKEGKGIAVTDKIREQIKTFEQSPAEKARRSAEWKGMPLQAAEMIIPGVSTATHFTELTTKEKVISIGLDVASVALILWGGKLLVSAGREVSGVARAERVVIKSATQAGKAGARLKQTTEALDSAFIPRPVTDLQAASGGVFTTSPATLAKLANKVETTRVASMKADRLFLEKLEILKTISPKTLKQLESKSRIIGLKKVITDVSKASTELEKAWAKVPPQKIVGRVTPRDVSARTGQMVDLTKVNKAQIKLQGALERADSVLKPRYTSSPSAPEFKGFRVTWKAQQPKISFETRDVPLSPSSTSGKTQLLVKERVLTIKQQRAALELKPIYGEPKVSPVAKVAVLPKVKAQPSVFPGITPKVKVTTGKPTEKGLSSFEEQREWARMTPAQKEKAVAEATREQRELPDARGQPIIQNLSNLKEFSQITPDEWQQVDVAVKAGIEAQTKSATENLTSTKTEEAVDSAVKEALRTGSDLGVRPLTETQVTTITDTILETPPPKLPKPPIKRFPPFTPLPRIGRGETREWTPEEIRSAVGWKQGFVIIAMKAPYNSQNDVRTYPLNKVPPDLRIIPIGQRGKGSARESYISITGKPPAKETQLDIGVTDALFSRKGLRFRADPLQLTRGDVNISRRKGGRQARQGYPATKKGKIYHTTIGGRTVLSRKRLGVR